MKRILRRVLPKGVLLVVLVIAVARPGFALPAPGQSPDRGWPQFGYGPGHRFFNPSETILDPSTVPNLTPQWHDELGEPGAVDPLTSAALANGRLYTTVYTGALYAVNAVTGAVEWSYQLGGLADSAPAVVGGLVFAAATDGPLYAFSADCSSNCTPIWSTPIGPGTNSSPSVVGGVVYIGGYDGHLYALDAATGGQLWRGLVNRYDPVNTSPTVGGGLVYVAANYGVYAFPISCSTPCSPTWRSRTRFSVEHTPNYVPGHVFAVDDGGTLYAIQARTGTLEWRADTAVGPQGTAVGDGMVFATSHDVGGTLSAFSASGCGGSICQPVWQANVGPSHSLWPAVAANGVVYVGTGHGFWFQDQTLLAFPADCISPCKPIWSGVVTGAVEQPMTVAAGHLFASTEVGNLYAFGLPSDDGG